MTHSAIHITSLTSRITASTNPDAAFLRAVLPDLEESFSVSEVADLLRCPVRTVRAWITSGRLKCITLGPRTRRVRVRDLVELLDSPIAPTYSEGDMK